MKHFRAVMPTLVASAGLPPALALDDFGALNDRPSSIVAHEERREGCANSNRRIRSSFYIPATTQRCVR